MSGGAGAVRAGGVRARALLEACVYAADLAAAERFYRDVLGLEVMSRVDGRHVFFRCGAGVFLVFNPERTAEEGGPVPAHGAHGAGHVAFAVGDAEIDAWRGRLAELAVPVEREVTWPRGGRSIYLRDPAGNSVELATPAVWGIDEGAVFHRPTPSSAPR